MSLLDITYMCELAAHDSEIEKLNAEAFGPARYTRAAYFIRQGGPHDLSLSFVALAGKSLIGSLRMTPIAIGSSRALLLGPIVVCPDCKNTGVGSKLIKTALDSAKKAGHQLIILIGDEPYYRRFGFKKTLSHKILMPAPVNPQRLLAYEVTENALQGAVGLVRHVNCVK
ncbi:MAG: Acetyltransferase [Candidatus Tokpelaia sp. JSC188]|nr:MAG: Acetyltransferase [Candidatus Tokpelaia sp. JSC188]